MLYLITGGPGNGKTAYIVEQLRVAREAERPLYVLGIPELKIPYLDVPPLGEWTKAVPLKEDPSIIEHKFNFPDGAVIVVDECQKLFRPRPTGSKVPPWIAAFETHRHSGLDFYLASQHPGLIDSNLRALVNVHRHIDANWAGRRIFEWSRAANPTSRSELAEATKKTYILPEKAFPLYKSSSLHVKTKRTKPKQLWVAIVCVLALVVVGVVLYKRIMARVASEPQPAADATPPGGAGTPPVEASAKRADLEREWERLTALDPVPEQYWVVSSSYVKVGNRVLVDTAVLETTDGRRAVVALSGCSMAGYNGRCGDKVVMGRVGPGGGQSARGSRLGEGEALAYSNGYRPGVQ
jgi:zona occludens toxin